MDGGRAGSVEKAGQVMSRRENKECWTNDNHDLLPIVQSGSLFAGDTVLHVSGTSLAAGHEMLAI